MGTAELRSGRPGGREKLERSLALALDAGLDEPVARAYVHLSWTFLSTRDRALADSYLDPGIAYAADHDLEIYRLYLSGLKARSELDQGSWDSAAELAVSVAEHPRAPALPRIVPLTVIGLLRARRGDADPWGPLDEALELARSSEDLHCAVAAARAEARWLAGSPEGVADETTGVIELALAHEDRWTASELWLWRRRAGLAHEVTSGAAVPVAAELAGDARGAAAVWTDRGYPYEAALALADSDDEAAMRESLAALQALGARPAAALVARRLRERGALDVRRGPRPRTRSNPAGLTPRQLEVLALIAQGQRNADIAARLFLSEKTVDHHVSAILGKLGVATRGHAAAEAVRLGIAAG